MKCINGRNIIAFSGSWVYLHDGKEKRNAAKKERKRGEMFVVVGDHFH
jgi:hypothetical protein